MSTELDFLAEEQEAELDARPTFVPEAVWPELKKQIALVRAGIDKRSIATIAASYGLTCKQFDSIRRDKRYAVQLEEVRAGLADSSAVALRTLHGALHDKLQDPDKVDKLSIPDTVKSIKALGDHMDSMSGNGQIVINNHGNNFLDVKALIASRVQKPE